MANTISFKRAPYVNLCNIGCSLSDDCITELYSPALGSHDCTDIFLRVQSKRGCVLIN